MKKKKMKAMLKRLERRVMQLERQIHPIAPPEAADEFSKLLVFHSDGDGNTIVHEIDP